jgi:alpha-galactosidase
MAITGCSHPAPPASEAQKMRDQWIHDNIDPQGKMPFSFTYHHVGSDVLLPTWLKTAATSQLDANRTQHVWTWTDIQTGLEVRCVEVEYADFPAVEWTVYLKNTGNVTTPLLENIEGLDTLFHRATPDEFVLNGIKGDWCDAHSYEPFRLQLDKNFAKDFTPSENVGKSCSGPNGWPYFNLQCPGDGGIMMAVGWPGQWAARFQRNETDALRVTAGQQLTHLVLKPGEQIRTPLIALLFWKGDDVVAAQNIWRRWITADNLPRTNGQPPAPVSQIQVSGTEQSIPDITAILKLGVHPDVCWRDANWYPGGEQDWIRTGTWEPDPKRYPHGFKPFSDYVHSQGMKFLLWFEPERVGKPDSWLAKNHPEWLMPNDGVGPILNEGDPAAWNWLVNHIDNMIKTQGIDWYREDMNGGGPLPAWRGHDAPDRQGITENLYVQGHLAYWDELRRRNPNLRIDSCASGGRRNDLESVRRSVPLLRSDFQFPNMAGVVESNQGQTMGIASWLPFYGSGFGSRVKYDYRSFYLPGYGFNSDQKDAYDECAKVAPYMLDGDFYPLTPYSLDLNQWIGWQFNRPEQGDGEMQFFRRKDNKDESKTFCLRDLDPTAQYTITNFDEPGATTTRSGQDLMQNGLAIKITDAPGSAILTYRKL